MSDDLPFDYRSCREAFRRLDDYLDRELTPGEVEAVRRHLEVCAMCADEFRVEAGILREVRGKLQRVSMPAGLQARIWKTLVRERRPPAGDRGEV